MALNSGGQQCVYASQSSTGSVVGIAVSTLAVGGSATGSPTDGGTSNGIGLAITNHARGSQYMSASPIRTPSCSNMDNARSLDKRGPGTFQDFLPRPSERQQSESHGVAAFQSDFVASLYTPACHLKTGSLGRVCERKVRGFHQGILFISNKT